MTRTIILCSGGTGGHVFPALSLAAELQGRGYKIIIMTDNRGQVFQGASGVSEVLQMPLRRGHRLLKPVLLAASLGLSFLLALKYLIWYRPLAVVGFGGYPSVPPLLAAQLLRIPTAVHEQNAILGRANRIAARFAEKVAVSYDKVKFTNAVQHKVVFTGTPVRPQFASLREMPYQPPQKGGLFRLFIMGGSQGARIFSDIIPEALLGLPQESRQRLRVHQQCRPEYVASTLKAYTDAQITADVRPFFDDVDQQLAQAHLFIGRSGASTVAEVSMAGRPALLVPYAAAMDNHQQANAQSLGEKGAAWVILERDFTPVRLREIIQQAMTDVDNEGHMLKIMAQKMKGSGQPDASIHLSNMVESLG